MLSILFHLANVVCLFLSAAEIARGHTDRAIWALCLGAVMLLLDINKKLDGIVTK